MQVEAAAVRPAIQITCWLSADQLLVDLAQLTLLLHFGEAQALVDEAALSLDSAGALCSLRMWLHR
jgi:hypothetical protein